jgi:hypothetical protein
MVIDLMANTSTTFTTAPSAICAILKLSVADGAEIGRSGIAQDAAAHGNLKTALLSSQRTRTKMQSTKYDYKPGVNFLADYLATSLEAMKAANETREILDAESVDE